MSKWDERYQPEEYVFGTEPNEFIARIRPYLPAQGRALDLATGEGRNGIFWHSSVWKPKAWICRPEGWKKRKNWHSKKVCGLPPAWPTFPKWIYRPAIMP